MEINIVRLAPAEFWEESAQAAAIYLTAFSQPPYNKHWSDSVQFLRNLSQHVQRAGFFCMAAQMPDSENIVGFAYGYDSRPGQWWHDIVRAALSPPLAARWLDDAFELVELAVEPNYQGKGIGGRLHDNLLANLPHPRAVLSTLAAETTALRLYRRRGWVTLLEEMYFPNNGLAYRIMGRDLQPPTSDTTPDTLSPGIA